jgi:hypothetical protein
MFLKLVSTAILVGLHRTRALPSSSNGRADGLPILGYNSYNDVACSPNETWMEASINALASRKLVDLGYKYFQVDCGWQGFQRLPNGSLTYDAEAFPNGIQPLSQLARSVGMVWSMYTDQGVSEWCQGSTVCSGNSLTTSRYIHVTLDNYHNSCDLDRWIMSRMMLQPSHPGVHSMSRLTIVMSNRQQTHRRLHEQTFQPDFRQCGMLCKL